MAKWEPTIQKVTELEREPWSIMIYGMPKVGKTVFACGAPKPLLISVDRDGEISLRNHPDLQDVSIVKARTYEAVVETLQWIDREQKNLDFETIIVDTISSLQEGNRMDLVDLDKIFDSERWVFNRNLYAINNLKVAALVELLLKLKKKFNIILTCHLKEDIVGTDQQGNGRVRERPALSPALLTQIYAAINGIFVYEATGDQRILTVKGSKYLLANSRYKIDKPYLANPTFDTLRKYLEK